MRSIIPLEQNPALRENAQAIPKEEILSERIQNLIEEMRELLSKEKFGVALAAPQVGESLRLFIVSGRALARDAEPGVETSANDSEASGAKPVPPLPDQVYINPEIQKMSRGRKDKHEGCLSIRGQWGMVPRAEKATIRALDERGRAFTRGASGFLAHVFQHEMDHLEGILYIDKASEIYEEDPEDTDAHDE